MKTMEMSHLDLTVVTLERKWNYLPIFKIKTFKFFGFVFFGKSGNLAILIPQWLELINNCSSELSTVPPLFPLGGFAFSYFLPVSCKHLSLQLLPLPKFYPQIFTCVFLAYLLLQFKLKHFFNFKFKFYFYWIAVWFTMFSDSVYVYVYMHKYIYIHTHCIWFLSLRTWTETHFLGLQA